MSEATQGSGIDYKAQAPSEVPSDDDRIIDAIRKEWLPVEEAHLLQAIVRSGFTADSMPRAAVALTKRGLLTDGRPNALGMRVSALLQSSGPEAIYVR